MQPRWEPYITEFGAYVEVAFSSSAHLWPWSGYLAISVTASKAAASWDGIAKGQVTLTIESPPDGVSVCVDFFPSVLNARKVKEICAMAVLDDLPGSIKKGP